MTAHVMKSDRTALLSKGMDGFLGKPASREQLLACVNGWLGAAAPDAKEDKTPADPLAVDVDIEILQEAALVQRGEDTDVSMLLKLIDTFISSDGQQIENIVSAAASHDLEKVANEAHALKSSAATFGAQRLNRLAKTLEVAGKEADAGTVADAVHTLSQDGDDVFKRLKEFVAGQTC